MEEYDNTWNYFNEVFYENLNQNNIESNLTLGPPVIRKAFFSDYKTKSNRFIVASDDKSVLSFVRCDGDVNNIKDYTGYKIAINRVRYVLVYKDNTVSSYYENADDFTEDDLSKPGEIFYYVPSKLYPEDGLVRSNDKNIMPMGTIFTKEGKVKKETDDEFLEGGMITKNINEKISLYVKQMTSIKPSNDVDIDNIRMMIVGTILINNPNFL